MKFKNNYRLIHLFYIIILFLFLYWIKKTLKKVKSKHSNSKQLVNENLYSLQSDNLHP